MTTKETRKIHVTISLSARVKAALCVRGQIQDRSAGAVMRDAVAARYRREVGTDLPPSHCQSYGRRKTSAVCTIACVLVTPEWMELIQAHAPGKARSWIAEAVSIDLGFPIANQRREATSRPKSSGLAEFIRQCEAGSLWPTGRELMRGAITGRMYVGCAA